MAAMRVPLITATLVALVMSAATTDARSSSDQRLAEKLVVAKRDVPPTLWSRSANSSHPLFTCIDAGRPRARQHADSVFRSVNSAVWSFADVFALEKRATRFYRAAPALVRTCVQQFLRSGFMPQHIGAAQRRDIGRYGDRSQGWRLRFFNSERSRRAFDWVVVRTGRAVLVDVFLVAYLDARWRDRTRDATGGNWGIDLERTVLRNAVARAGRR
jgi:hypothetical protein